MFAGAEKRLLSDVVRLHRFPLRCRNWHLGFKKFPFPPISRRRTKSFVPEMKQRWTKLGRLPNRSALRSRLRRGLPYIVFRLFPALYRKLPTVTVRIVEPE